MGRYNLEKTLNSLTPRELKNYANIAKVFSAMPHNFSDLAFVFNNSLQGFSDISNIQSITDDMRRFSTILSDYSKIASNLSKLVSSPVLNNNFSFLNLEPNKLFLSLKVLQTLKLDYANIITHQKELFKQINYLKPYQKRALLRSEEKQKENILLDCNDLENSDLISYNVENTIAFVDLLAGKNDEERPLVSASQVTKEAIINILSTFDRTLVPLFEGAFQAALSASPDKARQVAVSLRELIKRLINSLVSDESLINYCKIMSIQNKGKPALQLKLSCLYSFIPDSHLFPFIKDEIKSVENYLIILNTLIHKVDNNTTSDGLFLIINKAESIIAILINLSSHALREENL